LRGARGDATDELRHERAVAVVGVGRAAARGGTVERVVGIGRHAVVGQVAGVVVGKAGVADLVGRVMDVLWNSTL